MRQVKDTIFRLSDTDANILILGENGTGKDLVARMLKHFSPRATEAFVTIDLGSIPEQLFESELFGYEKGAFTDAHKSKPGRMEMASGGTLFLDEIGNLSLPMQAKLLTALEKRQIVRLGAVEPVHIDVRLICATNADKVHEGSFRQDLLYRINTIELHIPPLRERGEDIILLAQHFLDTYNRKYHKSITGLNREARNKLLKYAWPGNVRELQHILERAVILSENHILRPDEPGETGTPGHRTGAPSEWRELFPGRRNVGHYPFRPLPENRQTESVAYENLLVLPPDPHPRPGSLRCRRGSRLRARAFVFQLRLYIDKYRHLLQHVPHPAENGGEPEADHRLSETEGFQRYRSAGLC